MGWEMFRNRLPVILFDTPLHNQFRTLLETCFLKGPLRFSQERDSIEDNEAVEKG